MFFEIIVGDLIVYRNDRKLSAFCRIFFHQNFENCFRRVHWINLRIFFWNEKILSFSHTEETLFVIQSEIFQQGRQKELSKVLIISGHWAKSFRFFLRKTSNRAAKTEFNLFTGTDWKKNSQEKTSEIAFTFFGHWAKIFWLLISLFLDQKVVKSVFYVSIGTHWRKYFLGIFTSFRTLTGKKSAFRQVFFGRLEKTAFYVSIDIFWGEFFEKKLFLS